MKTTRRKLFQAAALPLVATPAARSAPPRPNTQRSQPGIFDVGDYGAVPDGARMNTRAIQAAIDACAQAGGGAVYFPAGRYVSGTIYLKNNVTLHLAAGAVLLGSKNLADYPPRTARYRSYTDAYTDKSFIYAEEAENIGIEGRGIIDGQGASVRGAYKVRPYLMRFVNCRGIAVTDVMLKDSPMWVQHYLACDQVSIRGITVRSRANANNDGIDIDSCEGVRISDCDISSGDDAIVLKSTSARPSKSVTITNCVLSSHCNALKLGTETNGGFENIVISNCAIYDTRLAGIAVEIVDGGALDRVSISNIVMNRVGAPLFIRLGDRARPFQAGGPRPPVGALRNVVISNIQATGADGIGCAVSGLPDHPIEHVTLENLRLVFEGGGKPPEAYGQIPEYPEKYPEYKMFGALPAYGLHCRHVKNLELRNVELAFDRPDERPALVCEDVQELRVSDADFASVREGGPSVVLHQVKRALIHGCRAAENIKTYLRVTGGRTEGIRVIANDLLAAQTPVEIGADVPKQSVLVGTA